MGSSDDLFDWSQFGHIGGWRWLPFITAFLILLFSSIYLFITRQNRTQSRQIGKIKNKFKNVRHGVRRITKLYGLKLREIRSGYLI